MDRESSSRISKNDPSPTSQGVQGSPSKPSPAFDPAALTLPHSHRTLYVVLAAIGLVIAGIAAAVIVGVWKSDYYFHDSYFRFSGDVPEVVSAEKQVVDRFKDLKNTAGPAADKLLAPLPVVPQEPISQEEADRFQANCFLHQNIHILSVRSERPDHFILVTKGNVSAPTLSIRTAKGFDRSQRTMVNPDLIVEVRDGMIHGIRAEMHQGP